MNQEAILGYFPRFNRLFWTALCVLFFGNLARAQSPSKITLETSETVFTFFAALNSCGYDQELAQSDAVRAQIRRDLAQVVSASEDAGRDQRQICAFYNEHQPHDPSRNIAQYVSLALNTTDPPQFKPTVKEADLPPDASNVLGFLTLVQRFYDDAGLHKL